MSSSLYIINTVSKSLLIVCVFNCAIIRLFDFDLLHTIFTFFPLGENIFYILVGLAGLYYFIKCKDIV